MEQEQLTALVEELVAAGYLDLAQAVYIRVIDRRPPPHELSVTCELRGAPHQR